MKTLLVLLAIATGIFILPAWAGDAQSPTNLKTTLSATAAPGCPQASGERLPDTSNQCPMRYAELPQCVEAGQTCVVGGTPCCGSYTCKGPFPNTTCK